LLLAPEPSSRVAFQTKKPQQITASLGTLAGGGAGALIGAGVGAAAGTTTAFVTGKKHVTTRGNAIGIFAAIQRGSAEDLKLDIHKTC
jgi:hypothetical protein